MITALRYSSVSKYAPSFGAGHPFTG